MWKINSVLQDNGKVTIELTEEKPDLTVYKEYIRTHEGTRKAVYKDTVGIKTIGIGLNLEEGQAVNKLRRIGFNDGEITELMTGKRTLLESQVEALFDISLDQAHKDVLKLVPDFDSLPFEVRKVLIDMSYNLGYTRLSQFKNMLSAVEKRDYIAMGAEIKDSRYFKQLPTRANKNIELVTRLA